MDLHLVRYWLDSCMGSGDEIRHTDCKPQSTAMGVPSLLIEIASKSIITASPQSKYAALSYVWGSADIPQLHHKDLVRGDHGWSLQDVWERVPQTIKDAILLCEMLSLPFLWVDALCIDEFLRDSFSNGSTELAEQMSVIYGGAQLTIVAAAGDNSWAGLAGVRNGSRSVLQKSVQVEGMTLASVQPSPRDAMRASTWNRRAWTFQEGFLSNRLLIFTENQILWNCNSAQFCEDICWEDEPGDVDQSWDNRASSREFLAVKRDLYTVSFPEYDFFRTYTTLVKDYTARKLTYQQDALDAFGGVVASLRATLETTFFYGIPIRFFEQCLLFDTGCFMPEARRMCFPTWSWVEWNQQILELESIRFTNWHGTRRNMEWSLEDFKTLVNWYRFDDHQDEGGHKFRLIEGIARYGTTERTEPALVRFCHLPESLNPSHVLLFEASTARLRVHSTSFNESHPSLSKRFTVHLTGSPASENSYATSIGSLMLDPKWRKDNSQLVEFEFVAIAKETREVIELRFDDAREDETKEIMHTLMITTDSRGISQRLQVFSLDEADWIKAEPQQRTVYLI
ncbi:hypothetical protein D0Z07_2231 [Hyphodiscus hymeniophilus]|uniref:Heterokaryon incompatibility domain-containing protein n=1 Tax=Hyphodiscus hymeniophilus TaxID=353542 RepID=A0A9P6VMV7_9HELO|nr:hypothetical protein D0Z07_2231 [Hyphodiscus hymeniophilus]